MFAQAWQISIYRSVRHSPVVERIYSRLRTTEQIDFSCVGLTVDVGSGDILIDCGANIGDVTSRFARTGATIYAFEPNTLCWKILARRFAGNASITLIKKGVMDRDCTLVLQTPQAHKQFDKITATVAASFSKNIVWAEDFGRDAEEVECIRLSSFIHSLDKRVKLLKIDIEGSEIEVLNDLIDTGAIDLIDHIVVETHERMYEKLAAPTRALRERIREAGLDDKVCLDWQ